MADQKYTYHGPPSGVTLRLEDGKQREVLFHPDQSVHLPADHPYVERLVSQQRLVAVESKAARSGATKPSPAAATKPAAGGSGASTRDEKEST